MKRLSTPMLAVSGTLAALVALATMSFRIQTVNGYVHLGDTLILFSAMLIGPLTPVVGGIGSALADVLGGYAVYALPTLIIKALVGFIAMRGLRIDAPGALLRCAVRFSVAELVMVAGYVVCETFMYGWAAALAAIPMNALQAIFSAALACFLLPVARRIAPMLHGGGKPL